MSHPKIAPDGSPLADSLLPRWSVEEKRKGGDVPMSAAPRCWGQTWQELCWPLRPALTHTPSHRAAKMLLVQSQRPGEKAGMRLNYFPQKMSKMRNCSKSILIATRWISDGNLLSFLPAYPPKTTLPETPISWEAYQAHSQRSPFDSGFQILLLSHSPDIKAPALPTRRAFSGTRDSQPCL